ncbi:transposase [Clostridium estertheticum]|uniref:transposase n=1 Tax=Clostridium estertheticum TaxID=238834 RepID=UPI001C0CC65C|nr:transposase [Clostridium estertheticum]MBU3201091.1 transposase [Clostridium estertheticum]WAG66602.1 transposase [Clostridium estertheticum]
MTAILLKNGHKSHKKNKKTVFNILGVCYKQISTKVKFAAALIAMGTNIGLSKMADSTPDIL